MPQDPRDTSLSGTIEFLDVREPASNVTVHVRVQETSRSDAPASTVAEEVLRGINIAPGVQSIPFTVRGIPHDARTRYSVRVHADVDGSGAVSRGDYVSTQSYPVQAGGQPEALTIVVRPVR